MTGFLAIALFLVLAIIALIHIYWAFGGMWPGHDERSLTQSVIGTKGLTTMPPFWLTMIVGPLIFVAGYFPLVQVGLAPSFLPDTLNWLAMIVLPLIFIGRGLITYSPIASRIEFEEPFGTLNRKYYSPLCLVLGLSFVILLLSGA